MIATGSVEYGGGHAETTIRLHDAATGAQVEEFPSGSWGVKTLTFSPDSERLAAALNGDSIKVWDLDDPEAVPVRLAGIGRQSQCLQFSHDGDRIISGGFDGLVHISDAHTGERLDSFRGHRGGIGRLETSPDGRRVATSSADGVIKIWNLNQHAGRQVLDGHGHGVDRLVFSADGERLISGSEDATIRVWDTANWQASRVLRRHTATVSSLAMSHDGALLASGNLDPDTAALDGAIYLWDREWNAQLLADGLPGVQSVALRPDGAELTAALSDGTVRAWEVDSGAKSPLPQMPAGVWDVAYSHQGKYMVALSW